jgi:hypothetical protein
MPLGTTHFVFTDLALTRNQRQVSRGRTMKMYVSKRALVEETMLMPMAKTTDGGW